MKNGLLSISVSIGILLSVCAITEKSTISSQAANIDPPSPTPSTSPATPDKGPVHDGPARDYVKHNPGVVNKPLNGVITESLNPPKTPNHPNVTSWFFAQLMSEDGDRTGYIRYIITDQNGIPSDWHSKNTTGINESPDSTLFSTMFDFNKGIRVFAVDGEIGILGWDVNGKALAWISESNPKRGNYQDDGDVSWTALVQ